jgi:4-carboxymuconolactone decarboxylase
MTDAASPADAGSSADAASPADAGSPADAASPADAGSPADAASPADMASQSDAASSTDAASQSDARRREQGMLVRREVLGDAHVDRAAARATEFTAPFQDLITRYAWGEIWSRPGLSRAERSMITLTALAALRQEEELAMHVRAAVRNGLTAEQITEVLLQVAVYAGVPAANRAFAIAQDVLAELGSAPEPGR